ncbi:MAG: F0F1 ATP synthase subunit B [Chloroflexota bacterium]
MLLDGFTIIAQIINFLILVFLLRRFLYGPITKAMDERQDRIAEEVAEAETLKQEAADEAEAYRQKRDEFQERREEMLAQAKEEAETRRKEFLHQARQEIEEARAGWHREIESDKAAFIQEVRLGIGQQVYGVSRRVLTDLADAELESQVLEVFLDRLEDLGEEERQAVKDNFHSAEDKVLVRTAFEISEEDRERLCRSIVGIIGEKPDIEFQVKSDLLCGIEMVISDYKLAWNLDEYLGDLEEALFESLHQEVEPVYE